MPNHRQRLLRGEAIQQIRNADLQALGKHHDFRVVQPAYARLDLREGATGHVPANSVTTGGKLLLSEAAAHSQFSHATSRKIESPSDHCSAFGA